MKTFLFLLFPLFASAQAPMNYTGAIFQDFQTDESEAFTPLLALSWIPLDTLPYQTVLPFVREYTVNDHTTVTADLNAQTLTIANRKCPLPLNKKRFMTCYWIYKL